MNTKDFTFDALLAYSKKDYSKREVQQILNFIKDFTIEVNNMDLGRIKYGGTILN